MKISHLILAIILLLFLLVFTTGAKADVDFAHSNLVVSIEADYIQDMKKARDTGKVWIVKIGAEWCGPCRALDRDIEKYFKDKVIYTKVESSSSLAKKISKEYQKLGEKPVSGIPDWVILTLNKEGKYTYRKRITPGYKGISQLRSEISKAKK